MLKSSKICPGAQTKRLLPVCGLGLMMVACQSNGIVTGSLAPIDYRERHPIALAYVPATLDLFVGSNSAGLDRRQSEDLRHFAKDYREAGRGPMLVLVPHAGGRASSHSLAAIRSDLGAAGVSGRQLQIQSYAATDSAIVAPVRLSFTRMKAKVANECGQWPTDIAQIDIRMSNWENRPYYNFGCSTQSVMAAQVADPVDLIRPRAETRIDTSRRMTVIKTYRSGGSVQGAAGEAPAGAEAP